MSEQTEPQTDTKKNISNTSNLPILNGFTLIKQGAEAKLYTGIFQNKSAIAKERFKKSYRHPDLDNTLNKKRIKNEVKLLGKSAQIGIDVPKVLHTDSNNGVIIMEFIESSVTCKEYIFELIKTTSDKSEIDKSEIDKNLERISIEIGKIIAKLQKNQIIHGDMTTSNILIKQVDGTEKIYFIDFGLSSISSSVEDKGVDLYVLERALLSTHSLQAEFIFDNILKGFNLEYGNGSDKVIQKFEEVRMRGRKRTMIG